jgi:thioesterase domain-containing protein
MKGSFVMSETQELSEARRALLEKYLRGEIAQPAKATSTVIENTQDRSTSLAHKDTRSTLITIQPGGSRRPFFYFHVHWIGGAFYSFPLSRILGVDQPFYVLDPYDFDGQAALPTLEKMAADYIQSIRAVQPEGPYLLGGFCGGGLIAFEVAQQLRATNQEVDLLLLIDPRAGPIEFVRVLGSFIRCVGTLLRVSPQLQLDVFLRFRHLSRWLRRKQDEYSQNFTPFSAAETLRRDWMGKFIWVVSEYVPRQYTGRMTYLWVREKPADRNLWWGKVTESERVESYDIDGSHETCRTEHFPDLANHLKECLSKVQMAVSR